MMKKEESWGAEDTWSETDKYLAKKLFIKAGNEIGLQFHEKREKTIFVESGVMILSVGDEVDDLIDVRLVAGESYHIPPKTMHKMLAEEDVKLFEVGTVDSTPPPPMPDVQPDVQPDSGAGGY